MKRRRKTRAAGRFAALTVVAVAAVAIAVPALAAGAAEEPMTTEAPVLGSKQFSDPYGAGFGHPEPEVIFNGGDPSGEVSEIHWRSWGGPIAIAYGREPLFRPQGGYYRKLGRVELRANKLAKCAGKPAYTRLEIRAPKRPGAKLGPWVLWSGAKTICEAPR
ncbi:MAG TPA: hypothetical protein VN671_11965 [Solirubrobacterales bacterium]|nr:hypothetical protein [Solirubrobacterales bacterium]